MAEHYDKRETQDGQAREAALMSALPKQIAHARANATFYAGHLRDVAPEDVTSRAALAELPVTRKSKLIETQTRNPPFGGLTAEPLGGLARVFLSPGPIADPEAFGRDWWRMGRALFAAGFREGELVHNCFAYHFTPAGAMFESAAHAVGCVVFPGGTGQTEAQVDAMRQFAANGYTGTPDFLKVILEKADEMGVSLPALRKALVSGGPLFPALRAFYDERDISVLQCYGTADLGLIAYESEAREGLILDEDVIVEIVRPGTGDPVPAGEVGEVLVTSFNKAYPLIRFATGDLSAALDGISPCGRTAPRIKGWMGRADQTTKVKGMFVHPEQVAAVLKQHPEIEKARLVVTLADGADTMTLKCESGGDVDADAVADTLRVECKLRGAVDLVAPGSLPNDGKVIEDAREIA